jgi:hypothetical protein
MAAPVPKDPAERRNTTKPSRGEWIDIDVASIDEPILPKNPPAPRPFVVWGTMAIVKWRQWRLDPVTTYWTKGDIAFAVATLELYNLPGSDWTRNASEIRLREDRLALTPRGKRDLRFRITFGAGKEATKDRPVGDTNVINMDERRKRLEHGA